MKQQFNTIARKLIPALALLMVLATPTVASSRDFDQCLDLFSERTPPAIQNVDGLKPRALCFSGFAVMHSGKTHVPIYVAEKLNKQLLSDAQENERTNQFFEEARLPASERAQLSDYQGSGYDRGHMAPAADMATDESMAQSFTLANMIPQAPINNRKSWAGIEKATRKYVMRAQGDVYVITGPVFDGLPVTIGDNHVWVPSYIFKLVYDPSTNRAWAHWLENTDEARVGRPISYSELVLRTGINFLPNFKD